MKRILVLIPSLVLLSGCTTTTYTDTQVTFKRTSFLTQQQIARLEKKGDGLVLEGYVNDQVSAAAAIARAAAEGAVKGAK